MKDYNKLKEHHKTLNITLDLSHKMEEKIEETFVPDNKNILKFKDIQWYKEYVTREEDNFELYLDCRSIISFDNDYYVSLISTKHSYGNEYEYELGLLHKQLDLVYDTHITDDVLGSLSEEDVEDILKQVSKLPKRTKEDNDRYIQEQKQKREFLEYQTNQYLTKNK